MQEVWVSGIGWDTPLENNEFIKWKNWVADLEKIDQISIPRCYLKSSSKPTSTEVHIFCDASVQAYAAVAYWRNVFEDGSIQTSLIASKSRVSPLKSFSIPKLELQAALLGSWLGKMIQEQHEQNQYKRVFWSSFCISSSRGNR